MNKKWIGLFCALFSIAAHAADYYGPPLCAYPQYNCIKIQSGQNWNNLFPDPAIRDVVQRLNRTYDPLWPGKQLVVPKDLAHTTLFDISPFPLEREQAQEKQIIVDQEKLAWAAYNEQGHLMLWGPISSGRDKCTDSNNSCRTQTGIFRMFSKESEKCRSKLFPIGRGGAKMPFCMYYHKGFALHGANSMPGMRASHGCVRLFTEDAKWLNHNFVELSNEKNNYLGTKVIVLPVKPLEKRS